MKNPNNPKRKIRHAKLLKAAGFEIDMGWYKNPPNNPNCNVSKLIYWKRGDITITLFDYNNISLKNLIERIVKQVKFNCKNRAKVTFGDYCD